MIGVAEIVRNVQGDEQIAGLLEKGAGIPLNKIQVTGVETDSSSGRFTFAIMRRRSEAKG